MNIKSSLESMKAYQPKSIKKSIILDANELHIEHAYRVDESTLKSLNRYPEHQHQALVDALVKQYGYDSSSIILGSGSSELLDLIIKTYIDKDDKVLSVDPTFVMYEHYTRVASGQFITVKESSHTLEDLYQAYLLHKPKIIIISNPNNPTGVYLDKADIASFLKRVSCIVIIDEAYIEFVDISKSFTSLIHEYPNMFVTRSFSKAFGLAGARLGYVLASQSRIEEIKIAKTPYSIPSLSSYLGIQALNRLPVIQKTIEQVKQTRQEFLEVLKALGVSYAQTEANFVYIYEPNYDMYRYLYDRDILIRTYQNGYYRISIGTKEEMHIVMKYLKELYHAK